MSPSGADGPAAAGRVEAIGIAAEAGGPLESVTEVAAIAGHGLEGDRYGADAGEFSDGTAGKRDLTLISVEGLAALAADGIELSHLESRRNVLVSGIDLNALVGHSFRIGEIECFGNERCVPCAHLQRLTKPGVLRGLVGRGGLRAGITRGGTLRVGDEVVAGGAPT